MKNVHNTSQYNRTKAKINVVHSFFASPIIASFMQSFC